MTDRQRLVATMGGIIAWCVWWIAGVAWVLKTWAREVGR